MNLEERAAYLQAAMNEALETGTTPGDIYMYESTIAEMIRISEWIRLQCKGRNKVYFEGHGKGTRKYVKFRNTTGIDFRFVSMKVKVERNGQTADSFELTTANWRAGRTARLYFDAEFAEGDKIIFDSGSIEYQVMKGVMHHEH